MKNNVITDNPTSKTNQKSTFELFESLISENIQKGYETYPINLIIEIIKNPSKLFLFFYFIFSIIFLNINNVQFNKNLIIIKPKFYIIIFIIIIENLMEINLFTSLTKIIK